MIKYEVQAGSRRLKCCEIVVGGGEKKKIGKRRWSTSRSVGVLEVPDGGQREVTFFLHSSLDLSSS